MEKVSFGEILRQTRERKGLDLNATARRLRIRPDILQAIEESNFSAMPPRGYARNMVNGYARYLGLNPTEITGMYLDELYAYQVENETSRMRPTGIDMPSSQSSARRQDREALRAGNRRTYYEREERESGMSRTDEWTSTRSSSRSSSTRGERLYPESRTHQARGTVLPNNNYTNYYSGPGPMGFLQANWKWLVAALVGLILLALIVSQIFSCVRQPEVEEVPTVPVTGVESSDNEAVTQPKAPTSFTFEYSVASGEVSWIEVYVDEQIQVGEAVEGPQTRSFTSSDTIQFITANPTPVTAKIDGEEVELEVDADGVVNMTWSFSDILAKWLADHPGAKASPMDSSSSGSDAGQATTTDTSDGNVSTEGGNEAADQASTTNAGVVSATDDNASTIDTGTAQTQDANAAQIDAGGQTENTEGENTTA